MLTEIHIQNFKSLKDLTIKVPPLLLVIGPNASGKTSLLQAIDACATLGQQGAARAFAPGGRFDCLRRGAPFLEIVMKSSRETAQITVSPPDEDQGAPTASIWFQAFESPDKAMVEAGSEELVDFLGSVSFLRLEPRLLGAPSFDGSIEPRMHVDGKNLATALAYLSLNRPDKFDYAQKVVRKVLPTIQRVRFQRSSVKPSSNGETVMGDELLVDYRNAPGVPGHMISEGTILALGVLAAVLTDDRPRLVLVDDLDRGLHPRGQRELLAAIQEVQELDKGLQILGTTHSPFMIDQVDHEQVLVMAQDDQGASSCALLSEHPRFATRTINMSPGEHWGLVGEDWVTTLARDRAIP